MQRGVVAIKGRAVGADDLVVLAEVKKDVRMVEGRGRAHAHEFPHADLDERVARVVLEVGNCRVVGHDMLPDISSSMPDACRPKVDAAFGITRCAL